MSEVSILGAMRSFANLSFKPPFGLPELKAGEDGDDDKV